MSPMGRALMIQGAGSNVGKSLVVAGLLRAFRNRGLTTRPFKPQNMSNNAAVTADGGESGRAQALQARAAGVPPHTDMNPVLLKPESETGSQLIVQGKMRGHLSARDFGRKKQDLMPPVLESFQRIARQADLTIVEGAGSPAEINLRRNDIAHSSDLAKRGVRPHMRVSTFPRPEPVMASLATSQSERASIAAFKTDVIDASMNALILVDFWAEWCGPCKTLTPLLERVVATYAPRVQLVKIDVDIPHASACIVGCGVMTGYGSVANCAKVQAGTSVAVIGTGGIGLNVIQGLKMVGADKIIGVDLNPAREAMARSFGMTHFLNPKDIEAAGGNIVDAITQLTDGGADYSFECIGNTKVMRQALECTHKGWGRSIIIGVAEAGAEIATRPFQLVTGRHWEGSAFGGARGRTDVPRIVDWYMEGKIDIDSLITHTMPLEDINKGFDLMKRGESIRGVVLYD